MIAGGSTAPAPLHEGTRAIWHLAPVLSWLVSAKDYTIERGLIELAEATMQVNLAVDSRSRDPRLQDEVRALLTG